MSNLSMPKFCDTILTGTRKSINLCDKHYNSILEDLWFFVHIVRHHHLNHVKLEQIHLYSMFMKLNPALQVVIEDFIQENISVFYILEGVCPQSHTIVVVQLFSGSGLIRGQTNF